VERIGLEVPIGIRIINELGVNGDTIPKDGRWMSAETRFIADVMLGKLGPWLRLLGCDVEYLPAISDEDLVEMASRSGRFPFSVFPVRRNGNRVRGSQGTGRAFRKEGTEWFRI
jgi:Mut7-C RNAse domain